MQKCILTHICVSHVRTQHGCRCRYIVESIYVSNYLRDGKAIYATTICTNIHKYTTKNIFVQSMAVESIPTPTHDMHAMRDLLDLWWPLFFWPLVIHDQHITPCAVESYARCRICHELTHATVCLLVPWNSRYRGVGKPCHCVCSIGKHKGCQPLPMATRGILRRIRL